MCTREDVRAELEINNQLRDKNLQNRLDNLREELVVHIQKQISEIPAHQTSPTTMTALNKLNNCSSLQEAKLNNMDEQLAGIREILDENRDEHKEIAEGSRRQHQETMAKLEEMSKTKADKEELLRIALIVDKKVEKDSFKKLEGLTWSVLAVSVTSLIGFLVSVIWFLSTRLLDK